jgi:hypothetical protein
MKGYIAIPPLRDLPPGRLAQRREHLLFEITRERESRGALARVWPTPWRRPRRRRIVVLAAAALVVAVGAASAIGGVRAFFLDRGFIGLPPIGATPSTPESGELVLRWSGSSETHKRPHWRGGFAAPYVGAWVYADGRMIWWRDRQLPEGANELTSGYLEQRLTPEGVELLRSEVVGLLEPSRALLETVPADDDPRSGPFGGLVLVVPHDYGSGGGAGAGSVEVRDSDRFVRLQWHAGITDDDPAFEGTIATPEQLSALRRIDALLTDPASVLPVSAWAVREVRAYVPSHYAVCIHSSPPKDASQLLSLLPAQAADVLRDKSRTRLDGESFGNTREDERMRVLGRTVTYCSKLATEEAREVADAVSGLERPSWARRYSLVYRVAEGAHDWEATTISFDPYFPDGQFQLWGGGR